MVETNWSFHLATYKPEDADGVHSIMKDLQGDTLQGSKIINGTLLTSKSILYTLKVFETFSSTLHSYIV